MNITVQIQDGPLPERPPEWVVSATSGAAGAVVCFEGVVRGTEDGRTITALAYEIYESMASRQLQRLAQDVLRSFRLLSVWVEHSRGLVPVGRCSFRLRVAAAHRTEALGAAQAFIDRLKQDVPIWKKPVYGVEAKAESPGTERLASQPGAESP
jgi:molybdopterin synthase catalytic subunit